MGPPLRPDGGCPLYHGSARNRKGEGARESDAQQKPSEVEKRWAGYSPGPFAAAEFSAAMSTPRSGSGRSRRNGTSDGNQGQD